jgi:hypothetical protein
VGDGDWLLLGFPYRLTMADVDGVPILVQIWARTDEDLAAWMPVATEFVDSIDFVEEP